MDALGGYGSDSSDDDTSTFNPPALVVPAYEGPSAGWIHGHANHLLSKKLSLSAPASTSTGATTVPLAQTLRTRHEFSNPKQLETTVGTLGIAHTLGSTNADAVIQFADWELNHNLIVLEEKAREQQGGTAAGVPGSDFVQNQVSRALMGGGTQY